MIGLAVQEGPWRNLLFSLQEIWFEICQLNLVPYLGIFTPLLYLVLFTTKTATALLNS